MRRLLAFTLLLLLLLLLLPAVDVVAAELPPEIARDGLKVAIVPNYPPMEFKDPATGDLTGFDVDLGAALARKLGAKLTWQETSFDQMMPAIATGRVDAILSAMTDYKSRQETATFVDYLKSGPQFFVQKARADEFKDMSALCGRKIGASRRTNFPKEIAAWSEAHCAGQAMQFVGTEGSADARTQLKQGRIDAAVQGSETLPYIIGLDPNAFVAVGRAFSVQYTGIALPVKNKALQEAVKDALDGLIADGTYAALLAKWKLPDNALDRALVNAGQ